MLPHRFWRPWFLIVLGFLPAAIWLAARLWPGGAFTWMDRLISNLIIAASGLGIPIYVLYRLIRAARQERREERRASRVAKGLCVECGYDVRASNGVCPECGSATTP